MADFALVDALQRVKRTFKGATLCETARWFSVALPTCLAVH
jgi:hypothetical protein